MINPINDAKNFDLSVEDYFIMLSHTIEETSTNDRHRVIKNFEPSFDLLRSINTEDLDQHGGKDVAVVYMAWDNFAYVKYALLSIMSNYVHTDLIDFPLKVIFGGDLAEFENVLRPVFEAFGAEVIIDRSYKFKYTIPNHFSDHRFIFNVDADIFFFGGRNDIYKSIFNYYRGRKKVKALREPYIVCSEELDWASKKRFFHPLEAVPPETFDLESKYDKSGFIDFWTNSEFLNLSRRELFNRVRGSWMWNIFSAFEPNMFRRYGDWEDYSKYCKDELEIWDDEFVYELWNWDNDIPQVYLDSFRKIRNVRSDLGFLDEDEEEKRTGITHPVNAYKDIDRIKVRSFFDHIQMEFQQKLF